MYARREIKSVLKSCRSSENKTKGGGAVERARGGICLSLVVNNSESRPLNAKFGLGTTMEFSSCPKIAVVTGNWDNPKGRPETCQKVS